MGALVDPLEVPPLAVSSSLDALGDPWEVVGSHLEALAKASYLVVACLPSWAVSLASEGLAALPSFQQARLVEGSRFSFRLGSASLVLTFLAIACLRQNCSSQCP